MKGLFAEICICFPAFTGWSPAEYAWDCHFMWSATFGFDFNAEEYLRGIFLFV